MPLEQTIKNIEENIAANERDSKIAEAIAAHLREYPSHRNVAFGLESLHDKMKDVYNEYGYLYNPAINKNFSDLFKLIRVGGPLSYNAAKEIDAVVGIDDLRMKKESNILCSISGITFGTGIASFAGYIFIEGLWIVSGVVGVVGGGINYFMARGVRNLPKKIDDVFERAKKADSFLQEKVKPYLLDGNPYRGLA